MKVRKDLIYIFEMQQESHCLLKSVQKWYTHEVNLSSGSGYILIIFTAKFVLSASSRHLNACSLPLITRGRQSSFCDVKRKRRWFHLLDACIVVVQWF